MSVQKSWSLSRDGTVSAAATRAATAGTPQHSAANASATSGKLRRRIMIANRL